MTLQEKELLTRFLQQLTSAQAGQKDSEAEALIREACARQPDATYLLVQRAIQLDQAFHATQAQVQKLQAELDQLRSGAHASFLNDPNAWGSNAVSPSGRPVQPTHTVAAAAPQPAASAAASSWGSSLFGNIASTAAGVVAGSFLFQGIQSLLHHGDSSAAAWGHHTPDHQALVSEPELLNSDPGSSLDDFSSPLDDFGGSFADGGDSGDFA